MTDVKDKYNLKDYWEAARRGMIWKGKAIEKKLAKFEAARLWIEEENITQGIFLVKSAAMYDNYLDWCKVRGITGKSILSNVSIGLYLTDNFQSTLVDNSKHYYINKQLEENEENKKKRKEEFQKKLTGKKKEDW